MFLQKRLPLAAALATLALACGGDDSTGPGPYDPDIPAEWAAAVTNPLFPLPPGTVWQYRAETGEGVETTRTEVLSETRTISGVTATVVHDQVFLDGELRVLEVRAGLRPWRVASVRGAKAVLELPQRGAEGLEPGARIFVEEA